ncbi:hypothetical protein DBR40_21445 [Pedobacter sp. KBW01]|uniref:hypothetical protein n=1 Tax=Pedobacter sp. KBW01 TaxID=2153364 RepID=UPI000F5B5052|nr:hypothetical protein [Pedobacter sp. KBW01]RQO66822.1 hypothetical protein DBR40_21445 [Pedobacter sp. KBW01]
MKSILAFLIFLTLGLSGLQAQTQSPSSKIKQKYFFIFLDGDKVRYFLNKEEEGEPIKNTLFPLSGTYSNIFMKWLNPLKYTIDFKDTVGVDPRDQVIKDYIAALQQQHGAAAATVATKSGSSGDGYGKTGGNNLKGEPIVTPVEIISFRNQRLVQLYTSLRINQDKFSESERKEINRFGGILEELDAISAKVNMAARLDNIFTSLYGIQDPKEVQPATNAFRIELNNATSTYDENEKLQFLVKREMKALTIAATEEKTRITETVDEFLLQVNSTLTSNRTLQAKVPPILELMDNSVKTPSKEQPGYYQVKAVSFDEGQTLKKTLTITGREYKADTKSFADTKELAKTNFRFERYDPFGISVSTGIFYGSTTLKGFGVSNTNNEFTVTQDDIEKGNFVTAAFLNFTFNAGSRYLLPFFQLGIDPTKKRPFLMAGGGFRIPSSKFALSAGPLWTWDQKLNKLTVGQKVTSTSDLEKDIKYEFDPSPKGWYLGFQYNF